MNRPFVAAGCLVSTWALALACHAQSPTALRQR